jgi:hypothetical protein
MEDEDLEVEFAIKNCTILLVSGRTLYSDLGNFKTKGLDGARHLLSL